MVIESLNTPYYRVIHNDNAELINSMDKDAIYIGFNTKNYDKYIVQAIANNFTPEQVKEVNDWIIGGYNGWDFPMGKFWFNNADIMDDMQEGQSLKSIEAHLGINIVESSVPFDIQRELTKEELQEVIKYCSYDVKSTKKVVLMRKDYLDNKIAIGQMIGLSEAQSLRLTNARLTAMYLKAKAPSVPRNDERDYKYPSNLLWEYVPVKAKEFFDRIFDPNISSEELFSSKLEFRIGECVITIGFGGIHGSRDHFILEATPTIIIENDDVVSYYPHQMTVNGYVSRNIPDPNAYKLMLEERIVAKKSGDKKKANALKLVCNTTYGGMLDKTNPLYDPLMGRSVCISGQLQLLELANHLYVEIDSVELIQLNTDGLMFSYDIKDKDKVAEILKEWQERTGFTLEADHIKKIIQKDVNNYIEVATDGSYKLKGGYLVRGIAPSGAFNVNNNATIISQAIIENLVNGIPVEETIGAETDPLKFQLIAKASHKFSGAYQMLKSSVEPVPIQRCNRVYATADESYGTLFKMKEGSLYKIPNLPDHCYIDNANEISIDIIDKSYYIDVAHKQINDYLGVDNKMPTAKKSSAKAETNENQAGSYKDWNVYQKLLEARVLFLSANVQKSGINRHLSFKYFELSDIVPIATQIFNKLGLVPIISFNNEEASMVLVNTDNPTDVVVFTSPMKEVEPIIGKTGTEVTNAIQRLGGVETYQRRYLYMTALDIVETDMFDNDSAEKATAPTFTTPPTETEKKEVTKPNGNASPLQIKQLKEALSKLKKEKPEEIDYITNIINKTSGLAQVSKEECEALLIEVGEKLA